MRRDAGETDDASVGAAFNVESLWRICERLPETAATDPLVGRSFGGVMLTWFIAEGGMGRVYEAHQANPARRVGASPATHTRRQAWSRITWGPAGWKNPGGE